MSTDNIRTFASDYYADADPYVQWVDDTSVNLVYKDKTHARKAMLSFTQQETSAEEIVNNPFELRTAKTLITSPGSMLTIRVAKMADRKKKNAHEASRYYLMHPEADPADRIQRHRGRGDAGDYKRRRFDDREHRRRKHQDDKEDPTNDFEASMYDDAPSEKPERGRGDLFSRITKTRARSASPVGNSNSLSESEDGKSRRRRPYRNRDSPPPRRRNNNRDLELFDAPEDTGRMRSDNLDSFSRREKAPPSKPSNMTSYEANQGVARQLRADLKAAQAQSPVRSHRRSRAIDTRVEEDLAERFGRKSLSLDSTKSVMQQTPNTGKELFGGESSNGFSIKGSASQGMSIKGRAEAKELFPDRFSTGNGGGRNSGKELFDQPVRIRGARQRAGDLFD